MVDCGNRPKPGEKTTTHKTTTPTTTSTTTTPTTTTPKTTTTPMTTTPKTTTPKTKTTPMTTTPKTTTTKTTPMTTTTTPTTTPMTTTPVTTTTTGISADCDYHGQTLPYPGDCHKYYICDDEDGDEHFSVIVFDCGSWIFDPNQGSCIWPEVSNDFCPDF